MEIDFTPFFKKYEEIVNMADSAFERIALEHPECVKCKIGCSDCCYALFDLSFIEALYINYHFNRCIKDAEKEKLLERANQADREVYKIKKNVFREIESGKSEDEIMEEISQERIRCALLNEKDECDLYDYRPVTCRLYGIPTDINGKGHTCGKSEFVEGKPYPTVHLDILQKKLYELSEEVAKEIKSRYARIGEILVPLSMALITVYDKEYLGIAEPKQEDKKGEADG